ncbi:hypothetical protein F2Q68_00026017 [Brassica cretica]|uniref:Uncharacterized protein n=1 Tax=Brassica cretica TaxID=69181 RepID=A0A8S9I817_BRACR|nr:hypothetical protein F2Q68_00026017 [Brassica cretica]
MVKCTSVGEIEEEDGTIMVTHPYFIVMTAYFMGLGRYTIVMGKALQVRSRYCNSISSRFVLTSDHLLIEEIDLGLAEFGKSGNQISSSVCYGLRVLSVKLDEQDQCHRSVMARLVRYRTPYEMDPFSCLQALDRFNLGKKKDVGNDIVRTQRYNQKDIRFVGLDRYIKFFGSQERHRVRQFSEDVGFYPLPSRARCRLPPLERDLIYE